MLIPLAMICSCQKQDSAAEQQLAQRKAELDTREKALDEREKALAEREKVRAKVPTIPSDAQSRSQVRDDHHEPPDELFGFIRGLDAGKDGVHEAAFG